MAEREHRERLIFELVGADRAKALLKDVADGERDLAEAVKQARVESEKAGKVEKARESGAASLRKATLGVAAAWAAVAVKVGEAVQSYAKADAANGRLQFSLKRVTGDAKAAETAFKRAAATFRDWEKFGVTVEEQTDAFRGLVDATDNYEQSLGDMQTAHDLAAQANIDFGKAAEVVRKVRQGEVEVLKEVGILTKDEAEELGRLEDAGKRTARAMKTLTDTVGGGAAGNQGLDSSLESTNAKLETTKNLVGEIASGILEGGTGLVAALGQMVGVLGEGEHPLDEVNDRLGTLRNHVRDGDWGKLAGVLMLGNPVTFAAGLSLLGISSSEGQANSVESERAADGTQGYDGTDQERAANDAYFSSFGGADSRGGRGGYGKGGVAKPEPKKPKKPKKRRGGTPDEPEGAMGFEGEFSGLIQGDSASVQAWQEAQKTRTEIQREEYEKRIGLIEDEKKRQAEADEFLAGLSAKTREISDVNAEAEEEAADKRASAAQAGIAASKSLTSSFIKDVGTKSVILGAFEVAQAIANYMNPPAAIAHGAAAIQYFAVAAKAGIGGGGVKSKFAEGGAKPTAAAAPQRDRDRVGRVGNERAERQPQNMVININSNFAPSREDARAIADTVEGEMQNRTGGILGNLAKMGGR